MVEVVARTKVGKKHFEILVDVDSALRMKKTGQGDIRSILSYEGVFTDHKKGEHPSKSDLEEAFGTTDVHEIAKKIILKGEVQIPQEVRDKQRSDKFKQVVDFLVRNSVNPQTKHPYTPERIERALDESGINISSKPIESQIKEIISSISSVLPIKVETKTLVIIVPARYTGQAYGLLQAYKEDEEWLGNGDLKVRINLPIGYQLDFYDKLNSITHGTAISEEIAEIKR